MDPSTHLRRPLCIVVDGEAVEMSVHDPDATVADLATALGCDELRIDGRVVHPAERLAEAGLRRGADVSTRASTDRPVDGWADGTEAVARVSVVAGCAAGSTWMLPPGRYVLGSASTADLRVEAPGVERHHAVLDVDATGASGWLDLTDTARIRVADHGIVHLGPLVLRVEQPAPAAPPLVPASPDAGWTTPWCRPIPPPPLPPVPAVAFPVAPDVPSAAGPLGAGSLVVPLVVGVVGLVVLGQPLFLVLGAAGAIASIVPRVVRALRVRRATRRGQRVAVEDLARFANDLEQHRAAAARRAWAATFDVTTAVELAARPDARLWARRASDADAYTPTLGVGAGVHRPDLAARSGACGVPDDPALWTLVEVASDLADVPVPLAVTNGEVIGVVGDPTAANAVVRSLVLQLATAHGPADLLLAAICERSADWEWMGWLPHARDPAHGGIESIALDADDRRHVVLVADTSSVAARASSVRELLDAGPSVAAIVRGFDAASLPAACTTVVDVRGDSSATVRALRSACIPERVTVAGLGLVVAERSARGLARYEDPELVEPASTLPDQVRLVDLLGEGALDAGRLAAAWAGLGADPAPRLLLGVGVHGPVEVDLARDGPHVLVAGTTGSGKSELLRSLVAGLAVGQRPDQLTFVLVDYKGGSAFDACAGLPHVVGVVTDLDEGLAERALRSLHAELARREALLRAVEAPDLAAYRQRDDVDEAIPRLVVVIDEFATLAAELPGFLRALVGIAQRGRSLGVHLVLATQRPAGVVSDDIKANTNLRIALRVQDRADAIEVVGDPIAATLPRGRPGLAVARFGHAELVTLQVAAATAAGPGTDRPAVRVGCPHVTEQDDAPSALPAVVATAKGAAKLLELAEPVGPWVDPLPDELHPDLLPAGALGLGDDPDHQRQQAIAWDRTTGHLVACGPVGSGATTALVTATLAAAATTSPGALHVYAVDLGAGGLALLAALPHTGAVIGPADDERQARLLRYLGGELDRRQSGPAAAPSLVLIVDDLPAWRGQLGERGNHELLAVLDRLLGQGPAAGVTVAASALRDSAVPLAMTGTTGLRLALGLDPPGRARDASSGLVVQVAHDPDPIAATRAIARRWRAAVGARPRPIGVLTERVDLADLPPPLPSDSPWRMPIGVDDASLEPAWMSLHRGDHLLISGPPRSGRSSTLVLLAAQVRRARPNAIVAAVAWRGEDIPGAIPLDDAAELAAFDPAELVALVDDAETVDDADGVLADLVAARQAIVLAAGRADALRSGYGHWTAPLRRQRRGVVLCPTADVDGDVLGVVLPRRRGERWPAGRGYLVADGELRLVQLALAGEAVSASASPTARAGGCGSAGRAGRSIRGG